MPFHNLEKGMTFTEYTQKQRKMTFMGSQGGVLGSFWVLLGRLGGSRGSSWGVLGRSWGDLLWRSNFHRFLDRFWHRKGCPKGGILGAKMVPKSFQKRSRKRRRKRDALGRLLGRFWDVLGGRWRVMFVDFSLVFVSFQRKRRF